LHFNKKKEQEEQDRFYAKWRMEQDKKIEKSITKPLIINQPIRSIIGSSVKIETVKLPINEGLCYIHENKYYGQFKKYEYDGSRGDPTYEYHFENKQIININPMENNNVTVTVVKCRDSSPESPEYRDSLPESPEDSDSSPESPEYSDSSPESPGDMNLSPNRYSDKVTIDYIRQNKNKCYQYYNNEINQVIYLGNYNRDERGSGKSDYSNYHIFKHGTVLEGDIRYFEIVTCDGKNRSGV